MPPLDSDAMSEISSRLETVIKLLAAIYTQGLNNSEMITKLGKVGLSPKEIAGIVGVSSHNVSQVLYARKKNETQPFGRKKEAVRGAE